MSHSDNDTPDAVALLRSADVFDHRYKRLRVKQSHLRMMRESAEKLATENAAPNRWREALEATRGTEAS